MFYQILAVIGLCETGSAVLHMLKKYHCNIYRRPNTQTQLYAGQQQRLAYSADLLAKASIVGVAIFNKTR